MRFVGKILVAAFAVCLSVTSKAALVNPIVGDCSTYVQTTDIGSVQVGYTTILDNDKGPNGYLNVQVIYAGQGWVAWGFSQSGAMVLGYSVVGIPGSVPTLYSMTDFTQAGVQPLDSSKQTLQNASLNQNATHTVMSFSKRLIEDQEQTIFGQGPNNFLAAWGSDNTFGYHGPNKGQSHFTLQACVSSQPTAVPAQATVAPTIAPVTSPAKTAQTTVAPSAAPIIPRTTAAPGTSAATVAPVILAPTGTTSTVAPTVAPILPRTTAAPATNAPTVAPVIHAPTGTTPTTSATTSGRIVGDCSQLQQHVNLGALKIAFTSTLDNDVGPNGYLRVQVVYASLGWVAWGYSQSGGMVPGYGVLGIPNYSPTKISMISKSISGVLPLNHTYQTLKDSSLTQNGTHTILTFTKRLMEDQEHPINGEGTNAFLLAWGDNNTFGYHGPSNRLSFAYPLRPCVSNQPTSSSSPIAPSPSAVAPTNAAPTAGSNRIVGDCSTLRQIVNVGRLNIGFTSILDNDVGPNGYLNVQVVYAGTGWVAWGYSTGGAMVPGFGVLGVANSAPTKISMRSKSIDGIVSLDGTKQTLKGTFKQNGTHSILTFSKRLIEEQELAINGEGTNAFLFAWGNNNTFGYHGPSNKMAFIYGLKPCVEGPPTSSGANPPVAAPTSPQPPVAPAPTPSATVATSGSNQIVGDCTISQQIANQGSLQVGFTSTLDNDVGPNGYLHVEVVYAGLGWLAWGYSANGAMVPGYSVVGVPGYAPTEFYMSDKSENGLQGLSTSQQTLNNQHVSQNGTHTILTFSKRLIEANKLSINGDGSNNFLLAWGSDNTFGYHGPNRLSFPFTLKPCVNGKSNGSPAVEAIASSGSSNHQKLWGAHGFFAAVAWGLLAPIGVGAALLRRVFISSELPALWFKIHQATNMMVFIFTTFAFCFAVRAISLTPGTRHFRDVKHRTTGLFIMLMVFAQTMSGLLRPHLPHQKSVDVEYASRANQDATPKKSVTRIRWEIGHRLMGFTLLVFCWWQVQSGLKLYASYYQEKDLSGVFWGITGALTGLIFIAYVLHFRYC